VLEIKCQFTLADKSVKDGWKNLDYLSMNDKQILELNSEEIPTHFQWYQQSRKTLFSNGILISSGSQHTFSHFGHIHSCFALSK
jgi:hypothetical protein